MPFLAFNPYYSAMLFHNVLADIQSKSGAGILTATGFLFWAEPLKNSGKPLGIDTCTGVLHTDCDIRALPPCGHGNQTIFCKPHRVGNQIDDDLRDSRGIGMYGGNFAFDAYIQPVLVLI